METLRSNKTISVFQATGLKILGREGKHIFGYFFSGKNTILCIFPFKMHKIIFFSENLKKF